MLQGRTRCIKLCQVKFTSFAKGIFKRDSLLPGKHSTGTNEKMGVQGGRSRNGERKELLGIVTKALLCFMATPFR